METNHSVRSGHSTSLRSSARTAALGMLMVDPIFTGCATQGSYAKVETRDARPPAAKDVDAKGENGRTPLMDAVLRGDYGIARRLIADGANVNAWDNGGCTALMWSAGKETPGEKRTGMTELLIANGADVNARDGYGETALMEAVFWKRSETAKVLIAKGADVNAKREDGMSALGLALKSGDAGIAQMLREHGARE